MICSPINCRFRPSLHSQPRLKPSYVCRPAAGSVALLNGLTMYLAGTPIRIRRGAVATCPAGNHGGGPLRPLTIIDLSHNGGDQ